MAPIPNSFGAASARGFGFASTALGPSSWALQAYSYTSTGFMVERGIAASVNGILCVMSGYDGASGGTIGKNVMRFFDETGTQTKSTTVNSYYDGPSWGDYPKDTYIESWVNNNSTTAPIFYPVVAANYYDPYGCGAFYHTSNTPVWSSPTYNPWQIGSTGYNYGNALKNVTTDSSGNLYIVPYRATIYAGKFTANQTMAVKLSSTGAMTWAYRTPSFDYVTNDFQTCYGAIRTDGKLTVVGLASTNTFGIYELTSTGSINGTWRFNCAANNRGNGAGIMLDSSNNVYIGCCGGASIRYPRLYKTTSAYAVSGTAYEYNTSSPGISTTQDLPAFHYYNGKIYGLTAVTDNDRYALFCVDPSTLLVEWTLAISFTGTNSLRTLGSSGRQSVIATSKGIYLAFFETYGGGYNQQSLILKVPLDGNLTLTSKALTPPSGANTFYLTTSKVTSGPYMVVESPINFTASTGQSISLTSMGFTANAGTTPVNGNSPTTGYTKLP